jgi:hypothetical protein
MHRRGRKARTSLPDRIEHVEKVARRAHQPVETGARCHSAGKRENAPVSDGRWWKWREQNGLSSGLFHSRCSLRDKEDVSLLKLHGVQTSSVAAVVTLSRAAAPEWILTRSPTVTACRGRHFAPRVKQTLFRCIPTPLSPSSTTPPARRLCLDARARRVAIRTEGATVARFGLQDCAATLALINAKASVDRHGFRRLMAHKGQVSVEISFMATYSSFSALRFSAEIVWLSSSAARS